MQTYLFYDIETTGLNKAFDQVLQFAAIRTTVDLEEIERYELTIKLNPDTIPSPYATITHHIGIEQSLQGQNELDAMMQIHRWLNTEGTISVGYNTLGFDDEFLRFSFYRNLLTPYTHQFANRCGRMDLYPIAAFYYLYKNNIIKWPLINGEPKLKLELINASNQFVDGRSHDAMVDVEVTLALAKRFFEAREMWNYVTAYFNKKTDYERTQPLLASPCLMIDGIFGGKQAFQSPVIYIGDSVPYKNQSLWLRLDTADLTATTVDSIQKTTWVIRKKWGEPSFLIPNKERFWLHISKEREAIVLANRTWIAAHPELYQQIIDYHRTYTYAVFPTADIGSSLYTNGFWSEEEHRWCCRFHQAKPDEKVAQQALSSHPQLTTLALRILGRHHPELLNETQRRQFAEYMQKLNPEDETQTMIDFRGQKRLTPKAALADIDALRQKSELTALQHTLLDSLENYLYARVEEHHEISC